MREHCLNGFMQILAPAREVLTDALREGKPRGLNRVASGRVRRQAFLRAAPPCNELTGLSRPLEAGGVREHSLSRGESWHQPRLTLSREERGLAGALEDKRGNEPVLVERLKKAHALGALPQLLAPARVALGLPP